MSFVERLEKLDREIAVAVEAGLAKLRAEIEGRLQAGHDETLRQVRELHAELPGVYVPLAEITESAERDRPAIPAVEPVDEGALAAEARGGGHSDFHAAAVAIDRARTQGDILSALLDQTSRFASRAALLLVRPDGLAGWGGQGFAQDRVTAFTLPRHHALAEKMLDGAGTVILGAEDCADIASQLDAPAAREGVLIPLVLRDRVTAALYADALDGQALESSALQTLAHLVALSIETLPFRERPATATLRSAGPAAPVAPGVPIAPVAPAAPAVAPEEPVEAPPPAATQALSVPEPEPEPQVVEPAEPSWAVEPTEIEPIETPEEVDAVGVEALSTGALEIDLEPVLPPLDFDAISLPEPEPEPVALESTAPLSAFPEAPELPADPYLERTGESEPAENEDLNETHAGQETVLLRTLPPPPAVSSGAGTAAFADLPADLPVEPALPEPEDGDSIHAEPLRAVPTGPDAPRTAEVRPPSGVQGPGWAFSTGRMPAISLDDEPVHEEARRLARLLVSEIKLYNEEQVEEGRRNRDIYERLKEDIDRSRQMYEDRVDPKVVATTDYFYQELVRILAAGDSRALGI
ncbi:MAG TPA: hypothetical protein VN851_06735 [Thermoanaerobaculia bacterium]|nr:hypothetical protein [Thermoanaerobaculia bacterium]